MSSPPAAPGRRARVPVPPAADLESGERPSAVPSADAPPRRGRVQLSLAQLGARDDGRAALLLFVLFLVLQQTGVLHVLILALLAVTCMRALAFCAALSAQVSQLQAALEEEEREEREERERVAGGAAVSEAPVPVSPLLLQLRLLGRELTPRDYAALLQLDESNGGAARRGLTSTQLAALPRHTVRDAAGGSSVAGASSSGGAGAGAASTAPPVCCAVCLEDAVPGDTLCTLPCAHSYHAACIERWLSSSTCCPVCKQPCVPPSPP